MPIIEVQECDGGVALFKVNHYTPTVTELSRIVGKLRDETRCSEEDNEKLIDNIFKKYGYSTALIPEFSKEENQLVTSEIYSQNSKNIDWFSVGKIDNISIVIFIFIIWSVYKVFSNKSIDTSRFNYQTRNTAEQQKIDKNYNKDVFIDERMASSGSHNEKITGRKGIYILIIFVALLVFGNFFGKIAADYLTGIQVFTKNPSVEEIIKNAVSEIRKQLPIRADRITTLTAVYAFGNKISYELTIDDSVLKETIEYNVKNIEEDNRDRACRDIRTRKLIQEGVTLEWHYRLNGQILATTSVSSCPS